jgi:hypothetical protein
VVAQAAEQQTGTERQSRLQSTLCRALRPVPSQRPRRSWCFRRVPLTFPSTNRQNFKFIINTKAAQRIGFEIPPSLLARADELIE